MRPYNPLHVRHKKSPTKYEGEQSNTSEVMDSQLHHQQWHENAYQNPYEGSEVGVKKAQKKVRASTFTSNEVVPRYPTVSSSAQGRLASTPLSAETVNTITRALTLTDHSDAQDGRGRTANAECESNLTQALIAKHHASYFHVCTCLGPSTTLCEVRGPVEKLSILQEPQFGSGLRS